MFESVLQRVKEKNPLVHAITNYVTVNDCANVILASGGAPIMADAEAEVCDITSLCSALLLNMGTLNERTIPSMVVAGKEANRLNHPVVFDPVGAGASRLRNETALKIVKEVKCSVIRGNLSEIKFLASGSANTRGVDVSAEDAATADDVVSLARGLARDTGAVIAITGEKDVVSDARETYLIRNGHPMMGRVSGTGCMLSSVIGCYCGANAEEILLASAAAVTSMGLCGELAYRKLLEEEGGVNSYRMWLIDAMGKMDEKTLEEGKKVVREELS